MALKDTILGWLRSDDRKSEELDDAEVDVATREYSEERTDDMIDKRFGTSPGEFEADGQSAPHS
jgi:hypothetical protein